MSTAVDTIQSLSEESLFVLTQQVAFVKLGIQPNLDLGRVENDGRKLPKLVRQMMNDELIEESDTDEALKKGRVTPTAKLWQFLPTQTVNLLDRWNQRARDLDRPPLPYFDITKFSGPELKYIVDHLGTNQYQWYVVDANGLEHPDWLRKEAGFIDDRNKYCWEGPFSFQAAQIRRKEVMQASSRSLFWASLAISSEPLQKHIEIKLREHKIEALFKINLGWGLTKLGILTEEESKVIRSALSKGSFVLGLGRESLQFSDEPEKWEAQLTTGIDHSVEILAELQKKLALQIKLDRGIRAYGGWAKFTADYRAALIQAVETEGTEEEPKDASDTASVN